MRRTFSRCCVALLVLALPGLYGQENRGWRSVDQPDVRNTNTAAQGAAQGIVPLELTIPAGTLITARLNQALSSDVNQPGDAFSATLVQPVVVNGVVVANRGQTVVGRVMDAQKAGRVHGVSRLGVALCVLTLADGQQVPVQSQLMRWRGPTSTGRDVGAIAGTTTLGAAIGGIAEGGEGAGIGAGIGAAAGLIGVLLTRGNPTVLYPESVLTFQTGNPVTIATDRAPLAFRYVTPEDYQPPYQPEMRARTYAPPPNYYARVYAYPYPPYPYPYFWGPGFYGPGWGPGFWGPGFFGPSFGFFFGGHGGYGGFHRH